MRIVHYFDRLLEERGGTFRACVDLCQLSASQGHDVHVLTFDPAQVPASWDGGPGTPGVYELPAPRIPGELFDWIQLREIGRALPRADVYHLHNLWRPSTPQVASLLRRSGLPYVMSLHGVLDEWSMEQGTWKKRIYLLLFARSMLRGAGVIHVTAERELQQARCWLPSDVGDERLHVVPYAFDVEPFVEMPGADLARDEFTLPDDATNILFLSRLHPKKRPSLAIRALRILRDRGLNPTLLLAGSGDETYERELTSLATTLGVVDSCSFLGFVSGPLKISLFQLADVFVLPTCQENFGLVFTEALACGTPVIASPNTDIWDELEASGGVLSGGQTAESIAEALFRVLSDREEHCRMGRAGRRWVLETFDPGKLISEFETLYRDAISG